MAGEIGIAASTGEVAEFGLRVSKDLSDYAEAISSADCRIKNLARDVELTSEVFQDAERVFEDHENAAIRNEDADNTARSLIDGYRRILENIDAILVKGRSIKSLWPFDRQKLEIFNAELDLKNGGMQLLLLTIQVASRMNAGDDSTSTSMRKLEELVSALEASSRRLEAVRTEVILTGGSSTSKASPESSPAVDPNGSTEFTYIDDSPPSPGQPVIQVSTFSSDSSHAVGANADGTKSEDTARGKQRIPSVNLESCIEHVQGVLRQIEEVTTRGNDEDDLSPKDARDLMDAYACTQAILEQIMAGSASPDRRVWSPQRESSHASLDASTGLGNSLPSYQRRLKRWKARMGQRMGEDCKTAGRWAAVSFLWLRSHLRQPIRCLRFENRCEKTLDFVDVLDRRFSFPWRYCCTWKGMEDLIKQAFTSNASICQRVYKGNYDLIGPDGAIILPMLWTTVVKPGWTVRMRLHGTSKPAHLSQASPTILSDEHWLNLSSNRGRSLIRRTSNTPVIVDVCEGPAGVQIIPQDEVGRHYSVTRKAKSAPGAGLFYRTTSVVPRPATEMGKRELSPSAPLLIDVSPRPRTRGKSRSGNLRNLSPVPPPPPPPPPPPVMVDPDEEPESVRVLSQGFSASEFDDESCVIQADGSLVGSVGAYDIPSTAEEALRRWTTVFDTEYAF